MLEISLCMIVKNEEDVLARCLNSIKDLVDEIIIVDTGSTDKTKEIAKIYTNNVYDFKWIDDFSAARNYAFSKATMPYCMWLDADDVIKENDQKKLLEIKSSLPESTDVVMLPYHTSFDSQGNPTFSYYRERIVRRIPAALWQGAVHEVITPFGKIVYEEAAVTHKKIRTQDPGRNIRIFENKYNRGEYLDPREQFYYARELYYHKRYEDGIHMFETFLNEGKGWIENNIEACKWLSYCYDQINDKSKAMTALFNSFLYDKPRAEICCDIGNLWFSKRNYQLAIYWYALAMHADRNDTSGAFVIPDCYGFLPCVQICLCYDRLGEYEKANEFNEKAGAYKPESEAYLYNKKYFESLSKSL